jgi:hypothetical protein
MKKNIECIFVEVDSDPSVTPATSLDGTQSQTRTPDGPFANPAHVVSEHQNYNVYQQQGYAESTSLLQPPLQTTIPIVSTQSPYDIGSSGYSTSMQPTMPEFGNHVLGTSLNWFPFTGIQDVTWNDRSLFCFGGFEPAYMMNDVDMQFLNAYNYNIPFDVQMSTPTPTRQLSDPFVVTDAVSHTAKLAHDAHRKHGVWKWDPVNRDSTILKHQDLSLPAESSRRRIAPLGGRTLDEKLDSRTRDRLIRLVVDCCESETQPHLPSWDTWNKTFPSVELLDALIQFCLHAPLAGTSLLFHLPTMGIRDARPELVMALVATGAIMTPDAALRKLGMALQEVLRLCLLNTVSCMWRILRVHY